MYKHLSYKLIVAHPLPANMKVKRMISDQKRLFFQCERERRGKNMA